MAVSDAIMKVTSFRKHLNAAKPGNYLLDETERLRLEINELKQQLEISQSKLYTAQNEVSNQSEIIALMTDSAKVHNSIISDLESRVQTYVKENTETEEKFKSLNAELSEQKMKNASLQEAVASSRVQLQQLQGRDVDCFLRDCVIKNLHLDVNEITLQYRDCYSEVVRQHDSLSLLRDENLELRVHTCHLQQEVNRQEARLSHLSKGAAKEKQEAISEIQKHSCTLEKKAEEYEQQNKLLKDNEKSYETKLMNLQAKFDSLSKENETLLEQLKTTSSHVSKLEGSVSEWSRSAKELTVDVALLRETNKKQEVLIKDCEQARQRCEKQLEACSLQVNHYVSELQSVTAEKDGLKQELEAAWKSSSAAEQLEEELLALQVSFAAATKTVQDQQKTIHKLTAENVIDAKESACMRDTIACLESEVDNLHQTINTQDDELKRAKDAVHILVQLEPKVNKLQQELDTARTLLTEQENQIRLLTSDMTFNLEMASRRNCALKAYKQLTFQVEAGITSSAAQANMLATAEKQIKSLKSQIAAQDVELEACHNLALEYQKLMIQAHTQALHEMSIQLQAWSQQNAALQMEVRSLRQSSDRLTLDLTLTQKVLQESANTRLNAQKSHSKQVQDLMQANVKQQTLVKQFTFQAEKLQAEVSNLQTTSEAIAEKNVFLEKSYASLLSELRGLKTCIQEHEQQIQKNEACTSSVAEQLQDCCKLLDLLWEDLQAHSTSAAGRRHTVPSSLRFDPEEAELQHHLWAYQDEQVKLISLVGLLNMEIQTLQQQKGAVASPPVYNREPFHSIVQRLLQDLERTAALNNTLQQSLLMANNSLTKTVAYVSSKDKSPYKKRQQEVADTTQEQMVALRQEKEQLLSEVAVLKKLQDEVVAEVSALSSRLLGANCKLWSMQHKMLLVSGEARAG